ncbi:MAG: TolC family protein [Deltaproteobacteria bacterium]|nr:TolC family protein [Deltaproteobacteria bacterium]
MSGLAVRVWIRALGAGTLWTCLAGAAHAQPAPPSGPPAPGRPGEPAPATPTAIPAAPTVDDPMLAPIARPKVEIATWEEALNHVRARSTDIRIAAQEVARAEGLQRVALAGALPSISASGTYTHNLITNESLQFDRSGNTFVQAPVRVPFPDFVTGQISVVQPALALRAWYAIKTSSISTDAAKLSYEDAKRQIALNVANAIVGVVTAERIAELNRAGLRNALQRFDLTARKSALGAATGLDVVRARQDVEVARATLVAGDETLRQARESLGLALGIPEQVGVPPNVDISGLERDARATCKPAASVDERADIAALRTRVTVAHRTVNDVKYQFAPTVNLQSGIATTTVNTGAAPNTTWNVQAVLAVPLWEGGARYGNLHETEAREIQAEQNLEAGRRKATIEITQARRAVQVAEDRRRVAASARDLALEADRLTRTAFTEGRGTSLELVTAAQALRESEIQLALRDFDLVKARVAAVLALASCPW